MVNFPDGFLRFLEVNFPDAFRRASSADITEASANSLLSRYGHRFQIWKEVPDWIKNNHGDRIPSEVLNGNITVRDYVEQEKIKNTEQEKQNDDMMSFGVSMLALGYAADTVATLTQNHAEREQLLAEAKDGKLTRKLNPEQFEKWLDTRRRDIEAIRKDWQEHQPEKYILHLAKELSRARKRLDRTDDAETREDISLNISLLEKEFSKASRRLNNRGSRQVMVDYLRGQPQQAALRHMDPEVLQLLTDSMEKQRIRIVPIKDMKIFKKFRSLFNHENISQVLKSDFAQMEKNTNLTTDTAKRVAKQDDRIMERAKIKKENKEKVAKTVRMRVARGRTAQSA